MSVVCIVMYYSQTIKEYSEICVGDFFLHFSRTHSYTYIRYIYISIYIHIDCWLS